MTLGRFSHPLAVRLQALVEGFRFWRAYGSRLRAARILLAWADGLLVRGRRDAEHRASRLSRRASVLISPALTALHVPSEAVADYDPGVARRLLRRAEAPYRASMWSLAQLLAMAVLALFLVAGVACATSPRLRHHWFPRDLAAGRPWHASSAWGSYPIQGNGPSSAEPIFFHTQETDRPWLEIDLGAEHVIRSVTLVNRTDCCEMRAVPVDVQILKGDTWRSIAERRVPFKVWSRNVAHVRARFVRVELPGAGMLHLNRVSVFGE